METYLVLLLAAATCADSSHAFTSARTANTSFHGSAATRLPIQVAFAAGGFGGGGGGSSASKGKKNKKKAKAKGGGGGGGGPKKKAQTNIFTPEGRMEHIKERIEAADVSPVAKLALSKSADGKLALDIDPNAIAVVDNFLGKDFITAMRNEAEALLPKMVPSQSTRWDEETKSVVPYEKVGVLSTQIEGGALGYEKSPRLVEYIVTLTTHLSHKLNQILPDAYHLSGQEQTNKLAVCLGDGSYYDKHIDNLGGTSDAGDRRKLTALLYIQPPGSHDGQPSYPDESVEDDARGDTLEHMTFPRREMSPASHREVIDSLCFGPTRLCMTFLLALLRTEMPIDDGRLRYGLLQIRRA